MKRARRAAVRQDTNRWDLTPRTRRQLVAVLVVLLVAVAGSLYQPPYVILRAGPAINALGEGRDGPLVSISGLPVYPTQGTLDITTVAQYGGPGYGIDVWDLLVATLSQEAQILPRDQLYPDDVTRDDVEEVTAAQMAGSQHDAVAVALRALGKPERAVVSEVMADAPAAGRLAKGDVIVSVGGRRVHTVPEVTTLVQQKTDAGGVQMVIERRGVRRTVAVPTRQVQGRRVVGVGLEATFDSAIKVTIDAGDVGGPSAGTMFALAVYDKLTPGALTGGMRVAGTGTIGPDGRVGPIGGITHKMVGAKSQGAQWFLAPPGNCAEVVGNTPDGLFVTPVATFDEAKKAVEHIASKQGRERLPQCTID